MIRTRDLDTAKVRHAVTLVRRSRQAPAFRRKFRSVRAIAVIGYVPMAMLTLFTVSNVVAQPRPTTKDSASVRIVEYSTIKGAPVAFRIEQTALRSLGGLQTDLRAELPSQTGNFWHRMADGRILVDGLRELKFFDASGKVVQTVGRQGQGPGEFVQNYMSHTCVIRGDTIVTFEVGRAQMQVFDKTGRFVRGFTIDRMVNQGAGSTCFADGTFLVYATVPGARGVPAAERRSLYKRIRSDSSVVDTLGTFRSGVQTALRDAMIYMGSGGGADLAPEFRVYSNTGRLTMIVRWNDALEKAPERAARAGGARAGSGAANANAIPAPAPTTIGAYGTMYADPFGRIWLKDIPASTVEPAGWTLFSTAGILLGRVAMPKFSSSFVKDARIIAFDGADLVVRWTDDDGVHITTHKLSGPSPGQSSPNDE